MYLKHVSSFADEQTLNIRTLARVERFLGEVNAISELGYSEFHTAANFTSASLAIEAAQRHMAEIGAAGADYKCVIYCHYWNDENWNELHAFRMHNALALSEDARCFELKAGNQTSMFHAMYLAELILAEGDGRDVLVVCADKIDTRFVQRKLANGIFGDAAGAITLSKSGGTFQLKSPVYNFASSEFFLLNKYDLETEGRIDVEIDRIGAKLKEKLAQHTDLKSVNWVVTHNYSVDEIARRLEDTGIDGTKLYTETLPSYAHVPTAGYILNLDLLLRSKDHVSGDQILIWGGGVGVSATGVIIEKAEAI